MREIRIIFMSIAAALIVNGAGSFVHGELVVHYPFDDGTATDISGNGNHGNIVGNVAMAFDSERGNVMYFPGGNNHYIRVPASPSLNAVAASYTMAAVGRPSGERRSAAFELGQYRLVHEFVDSASNLDPCGNSL